jgi:hypothetical protein
MLFSNTLDVSQAAYYYPFVILFFLVYSGVQVLIWMFNKEDEENLQGVEEWEKIQINDDKLKNKGNYLKFTYMSAYLLTKSAMWAKAPYTYMLFSKLHGFSVEEIGLLYLIDAVCSVIAGPFTGIVADTFGRRMVALIYPLNTVVVLSMRLTGNISLAYLSQIMTGFAGNILCTAFESWLNYEISSIYGNFKNYIHHFRKEIFSKILFWDSILSLIVTVIGALIYVSLKIKIRLISEFSLLLDFPLY